MKETKFDELLRCKRKKRKFTLLILTQLRAARGSSNIPLDAVKFPLDIGGMYLFTLTMQTSTYNSDPIP